MPAKIDSPVPPPYCTADMVRAMPDDGNRYEVVYGELLVSPSPRMWHQVLVKRLAFALNMYLRSYPAGILLSAPADVSWGEDVLVQPDVFVVPVAQARALQWSALQDLWLIVEVLSPSTAANDRFIKRRRYQEAGVPCYWIVDGDEHYVEIWRPGDHFPTIEREQLVWRPEGSAEPFTLSLGELFRPL